MELNINLQDIDALEGDGLDAGNGHAPSSIDGYLLVLWKCYAGNLTTRWKRLVNALKFAVEG